MPTPFQQYHDVLKAATLHTDAGDHFENAAAAYYETRKFRRVQDLPATVMKAARYQGVLEIESKCLPVGSTHALAGEVLSWECGEKPKEPAVEQVKKGHNGQVGMLKGAVYCRISRPYRNLPT